MTQSGPSKTEKDKELCDVIKGDLPVDKKVERIHQLIEKENADINYKSEDRGFTPLHFACEAGNLDVVQALLSAAVFSENEINFRSKDIQERTPLDIAVEGKHEDIIACIKRESSASELDKSLDDDQDLSSEEGMHLFLQSIGARAKKLKRAKSELDLHKLQTEGETPPRLQRSLSVGSLPLPPKTFDEKSKPKSDDETVSPVILHQRTKTGEKSPEPPKKEQTAGSPFTLDDDHYEAYQQAMYGSNALNDPYIGLGNLIKQKNAIPDSTTFGQTGNFKKRLDNIIPLMEFAVRGARKDVDSAVAESGPGSPEHAAAQRKLQVFENVQGMFDSLKALANNKIRYTPEQFNAKVDKVLAPLDEHLKTLEKQAQETQQAIDGLNQQIQPLTKEDAEKLDNAKKDLAALQQEHNTVSQQKATILDAVRDVAAKQTFTSRGPLQTKKTGSTPFEAGKNSKEVNEAHHVDGSKVSKRVKIEHEYNEDGTSKVTVRFSYNRQRLLGTRPFGGHLKMGSSAAEVKELKAQTAEAVTVAINEFNKGSKENPIQISYNNPRYPQPEAALAVLMEFKKRAIESGKPFYAKDANGKLVEISPKIGFNEDERKLFAQYAIDEKPVVRGRKGVGKEVEEGAGYKLFKDVNDPEGNTILKKSIYKGAPDAPDPKNPQTQTKEDLVFAAMEQHLVHETRATMKEMNAKMDGVVESLGLKKPEKAEGINLDEPSKSKGMGRGKGT